MAAVLFLAISTATGQSTMSNSPQANQEADREHDRPRHHLGWQITGKCNRACRYCLRRRTDKPTFELGEEDCARILESYLDFVAGNRMTASIMFSGGNPMLRPDLPVLLRRTLRAKDAGILDHTCILANPETMDAQAIGNIAECRVDQVVISLDGRKENNDRMRGAGSFDAAVAAIRNLSSAGVAVNVKYTLSRYNVYDVQYTRDLAMSLGARHVGIGIISPPDGAGDLSDLMLTPAEYREYLLDTLRHFESLPEERRAEYQSPMRMNRGLYALLFHELGRYEEFRERTRQISVHPAFGPRALPGSGQGRGMFVVWEDGSVHASNPNAHPILGQVPQESFQAIHERRMANGPNPSFRRMPRDSQNACPTHEVCMSCPVREHCPGDNRYCWKLR